MDVCDRAVGLVDLWIADMGLDPDTHRLTSHDSRVVWGLQKGSAAIYIAIVSLADSVYLHVYSPILKRPTGSAEAFYLRLLELNATELTNCAFAIEDDHIVVLSQRKVKGLDLVELEEVVLNISGNADRLDDALSEEFGVEMLGSARLLK